jgi:hypothetical protein
MKISSQLSGIAGEYYVAAELSRRGYLAAITLRNSDGVDILASSIDGKKLISIQVKSTQGKRRWILNKKVEEDAVKNKYFAFVHLPNKINEQPEFYIVSSKTLANKIYAGHRRWLSEPGKNGRIRKDSNTRQFDPKYFLPDELVNGWEELIEIIESK